MTSVSGHLMCYDFGEKYRSWRDTRPEELFTCPIEKNVLENMNIGRGMFLVGGANLSQEKFGCMEKRK